MNAGNKTVFILAVLVAMHAISCSSTKMVSKSTHRKYTKVGTEFKTVQTDSSSIYLRQIDRKKEVLVLIHGFGPLPGYQWRKVMEELGEDYTLVIPDMIFFGESYSEYSEFSPHFQASQIQKCIANLGYDRYFIAGLSYGGLVASILAHDNPDHVKGLILIDALTKFSSRDYSDSIALTFGESSAEKLLLPEDGKGMKKLIKVSYYKAPPIPAFLYNKPAKTLYYKNRMQKEGMVFYLSDNEKELQTDDYQFDGPVCIIWGREDLLTPIIVAYELEEYYHDSEVPTILEKTGHASHLENPEELAKRIREFTIKHGDS